MSLHDEKLYIVMVGLPAMGKSTLAARLQDAFGKSRIPTRIFNNGDLRRKYRPLSETSTSDFYHPDNAAAAELRKKFASINLQRAKAYLRGKGQVAILDAANVSRERREMIEAFLDDHPILFIECINDDQDLLDLSISEKTKLPEFSRFDQQTAEQEFLRRIDYYRMIYTPLKKERNYIRMDSLQHTIPEEKHVDGIPLYLWVRDLLVTDVVKNLFLVRHTETAFNVIDRIGGDPPLTAKGVSQAQVLGRFFSRRDISYIFTSSKQRTLQTAQPIARMQTDCTIIPIREFDEINGGLCDEMTYRGIEENMPAVFQGRKADKYHYIYPGGESYETMKRRIEMGIKKAFFLKRHADNIMIIGHQAVNRMILAHFLYRRESDIPYIYIPQDRFYHIIATPSKRLFELRYYH
jgi:broad specificity phosphatase PhoE/predicted kinase